MKEKVQGLHINKENFVYTIREVEVSITEKCHLRCNNCGFCIPNQPLPSTTKDVISEIAKGLETLQKLDIQIGSLGILGGEPSFNKKLLEDSLIAFSKFTNIAQIELVTHGLTPQNISIESLSLLDKISISIYFDSDYLIDLWTNYIKNYAPHINLSFRKDKKWDLWFDESVVDDEKAQEMFEYCWYRKHCVTIERGRLFLCSRIPKLSNDQEGILLTSQTSLKDVRNYLNGSTFLPSCKTCTPMMGLETIAPGIQPDNRIERMTPKAIQYLENALHEKP